ncbi:hypothetical protein FIV42_18280 [Persicimonas caeni]|uniref:Uncharacterized protein n=1 Tax=Persicimonas caeni TaxID=2292766 RepID=A0A4Y6PWI9_PERCE|nr:hypothetical protein [Persicimonas caeni]QDG52613.1 hypothetical protein FIV42_18280 [Persicimonas caeni]QED33835.1 hypothetical protein FRD00_18275 [Persicimonas caeni]
MTRDERDRFADLFCRLMHADTADSDTTTSDRTSALRLLSHSLLNYLGTTGTHATGDLAEALGWLGAFLDWTRGDADAAQVAERLARSRSVDALSPAMIERRLAAQPVATERPAPREPQPPVSDDPVVAAIAEVVDIEHALASLLELAEDKLRSRLIDDSVALAASLELCEDAIPTPLAERLLVTFPSWNFEAPVPVDSRRSNALWMLAALESTDAPNPLGEGSFRLSQRDRGFERGLAQNMARLELIPVVRAALAFGGDETLATFEAREAFLRQFTIFRSQPALLQLASALIEIRGRCIDYVCGGMPFASMSPWIEYLRGPCVELAEVRECTLREAMSYAHYCLHLVNVCDFASMGPEAFNQKTRDTLTSLEEELKEFALAGQREGLSDGEADLGRFERARWRRAGDASYLADRLSRLRGAWRRGTTPGPMGAPPSLEPEITAHSMALVESLVGQSCEADIAALARLVENACLKNFHWLEYLEPAHILELLAITVTAARDLPGIDVSRRFQIDLSPLARWATDADRGQLNRRILSALLDRRRMSEILNGTREPSALRRGIVGQVVSGETHQPRLIMHFVADPELQALLELLGTTTSDDDGFHAVLERRLEDMLQRHQAPAAETLDHADLDAAELSTGARASVGDAGV